MNKGAPPREIEHLGLLLTVLRALPRGDSRAIMLQSYIAEHGPIPDEVGDEIRQLLRHE